MSIIDIAKEGLRLHDLDRHARTHHIALCRAVLDAHLRLRGLCQSLVNAAGADGPMSAEDAAAKLVEKYAELEAENARLKRDHDSRCDQVDKLQQRLDEIRVAVGGFYADDLVAHIRVRMTDYGRLIRKANEAEATAPQAQRETDEQQNAVGTRSGAFPADSHAAATCGSSVADSPLVGVAPVSESNDEGLPVSQVKGRQPASDPSPAAPGAAREWDREQQQSAASVVLAAMHGPLEDVCAEIAKHAHLFAKPAPVSAEDVERACEAAWNAGGHRPAWRDLNETVRVLFRCSFRAALASLGIKAAEDVK